MSDVKGRDFPRVAVKATADINSDDLQLFNHIQNMSLGGACVNTAEPESVGSMVDLVINLPDGYGDINITGEVVWTMHTPQSKMGVRFLDVSDEVREILSGYLYGDKAN